jgi:hypothetical protein
VKSQPSSGSLKGVERKLAKCRLDLVVEHEVRWDKAGAERAEEYSFVYGKKTKIIRNRISANIGY